MYIDDARNKWAGMSPVAKADYSQSARRSNRQQKVVLRGEMLSSLEKLNNSTCKDVSNKGIFGLGDDYHPFSGYELAQCGYNDQKEFVESNVAAWES